MRAPIIAFIPLIAPILACKEAPRAAPALPGSGLRDIVVTAKGFEPSRVEVKPSSPVVLRFTRKVAETCADAVLVQGDPVKHMLPVNTPVEVKVTAPASGQLAFACPMDMYRGSIVVVAQ